MAATSCVAISGRRYCFPKSTNLKIDLEKGRAYVDSDSILFNFEEEESISLNNRHALRDASGNPIFTLHNKFFTMHDRWEIFKGEDILSHNLLFTVKRKSMIQWGEFDLEIFLANNNSESVCDFTISASFLKRTCTVSVGQSSTPIAKIKKIKGGNFEATVNPNTDLAFIATLMIILRNTKLIDGVTTTTFKIGRRLVDPFDASGLLFDLLMSELPIEETVETLRDVFGNFCGYKPVFPDNEEDDLPDDSNEEDIPLAITENGIAAAKAEAAKASQSKNPDEEEGCDDDDESGSDHKMEDADSDSDSDSDD